MRKQTNNGNHKKSNMQKLNQKLLFKGVNQFKTHIPNLSNFLSNPGDAIKNEVPPTSQCNFPNQNNSDMTNSFLFSSLILFA